MCASRVGTGCRYPLMVARTTATAPSRSIRCPGETKTGLARRAVRSTTPTGSPPIVSGDVSPGFGPGAANLGLDGAGGLDVLREGHSVGDDRRFQRNHGASFGKGCGDSGGEGQEILGHDPVSPEM